MTAVCLQFCAPAQLRGPERDGQCRHIMAAHLASDPEPGAALQSLAQQASYFLLAVSIR